MVAEHGCSSASVGSETSTHFTRSEVSTMVRRLATQEHYVVLAQLSSLISAVLKFGAATDENPFMRVNTLITELISWLQDEASLETRQKACFDEETLKATEKEDLGADTAKHSSKISSRDRILQCTVEQILDVPVPEKVEQLTEMPKIVSQNRIQQRTVEQTVDLPVPQDEEEPAEFFMASSQDRTQQRYGEQTIEPLAISFVGKIVEMPVQTQEKTRQGTNPHVVNTVEAEMPKIIKETVQRKWPVINEKIDQATKHPEVPQVQVSEKAVEIPQLQVVRKIDDIPEIRTDVGTHTSDSFGAAPLSQAAQVEIAEAVEIGTPIPAESRPPIFVTAPVLEIPVVGQRQALNIQTEQKTIDVPQIRCLEPLVDVPVVTQQTAEIPVVMLKQAPTLHRIQKMVEVPQIQYIDKVVDAPVEMQSSPEMEHVASTLATEWEASTPHVVDSSLRKKKSSGSLQSPRARNSRAG